MSDDMMQDDAVAIYELSQDTRFHAVYRLLIRIAQDYYADMPKKDEDRTAYETSNWVANTIRLVTSGLDAEIRTGQRIVSRNDNPGGDTHAGNDQHRRRRC